MENKKHELFERMKSVFSDLQGIYEDCENDEEFFRYLNHITGGNLSSNSILNILHRYDKGKGMVIPDTMMIIDQLSKAHAEYREHWIRLINASDNFKPGLKGADGGFKACKDLLEEEKQYRLAWIETYLEEKKRTEHQSPTIAIEGTLFRRIPDRIRAKIRSKGKVTAALIWLSDDYGISVNTLRQILYSKQEE